MSLIVALYAIKVGRHLSAFNGRRAKGIFNQLTGKNASTAYSYGWHRAEILAALLNATFLLALCFSIFMEAIERFVNVPGPSVPFGE
jgi:divalent metal cation (Fe/Co/Zn/Cd) transporter